MSVDERGLALARHYLDIEQPARALETLAGRQHELADPEYWRLRAAALVDLDREREAADAAARGLDLDPDDVGLLALQGVALAAAGDLAGAERSLLAALRLDPENPPLLTQYALLVAKAGQLEKARRLLAEAERLDPLHGAIASARTVVAYLDGDDQAAQRHADALLADDPEAAEAHLMRGAVLAERGSARAARRHFEAAARIDPGNAVYADAARRTRRLGHPLLLPLWPFLRFGPGKVWLVYIALFVATLALGVGWLTTALVGTYLALVVYSWVVPPLVLRWLGRDG